MASTASTKNIQAVINADEISGQIAVGENILQVGSNHGVIIYQSGEAPPEPKPRTRPVSLLPRKPERFLDREKEVSRAVEAVDSAQPFEYQAPPGVGKTTLLRRLAHREAGKAFPDGVVYQRVGDQPLEDVLQLIYDAFYEFPGRSKPTPGELRHALSDVQALILLDDFDLTRDDAGDLLDHLPESSFALAAPESRLAGLGETQRLAGLPLNEAVELFAQALGRSIGEAERPSVRSICEALDGHPLQVIQAARRVRQGESTLAALMQELAGEAAGDELALNSALSAEEDDEKLLAALAVVGGGPLPAQHLKRITELSNAGRRLERLAASGIVVREEDGFRLAGGLAKSLRQTWGDTLDTWGERSVAHFLRWAERNAAAPERALEISEALRGLMEWALDGERWADVIRLGRAVDGSLALTGRWGAWRQVLDMVLQAAVKAGDGAAEAWALHQMGARAFGLGDLVAAERMLSRAAELRQAAGDTAGQSVSEHNLSGARAEPLPLTSGAGGAGIPWLPLTAGVAIVAGGIGAAFWWNCCGPGAAPEPTEPVVAPPASDTPTPTPTGSITPSPTPTPTPTMTFTPSPPDLTVPDFTVDRLPGFDAEGRMVYPARVEVANGGDLAAEDFKVSASYTGGARNPNTPFTVPFTVPGQESAFYPRVSSPLEGGDTVTFDGIISLNPVENDRPLTLSVLADSCAGEEFVPEHCHVLESDEENNSASVRLLTPACFDFNRLESGEFFEAGSPPLKESSGTLNFEAIFPADDDVAEVGGTTQVAFGWSQRLLEVRDMKLSFSSGVESTRTAFAYSELAGAQMIRVNGERIDLKDFRELDGDRVGGTELHVLREADRDMGVVVIEGALKSLEIGNRDGGLRLDNICWMEVQP